MTNDQLPTHRLPILIEIPDEAQHQIPVERIIGALINEIAGDRSPETNILVEDVKRIQAELERIVLAQLPVEPAVPQHRVVVLRESLGLLTDISRYLSSQFPFLT
jgi:hypothetical protein